MASRPSEWVERHLGRVRNKGSLLDVACGGGRHARLALERGFTVTVVDRDLSGVADLAARGVEMIEADLEQTGGWPFSGRRYDAVIVTNYLWRPLLAHIVAAVADDGVLIYETFAAGHEVTGKPSNPDYLLKPGELVEACRAPADTDRHLVPISFEQRWLEHPTRLVQRIFAVGRQHSAVGGNAAAIPCT